jgi:hypothetical protein
MAKTVLTVSCSFVDRDMFMRHFGHGVGHLQYGQQHEIAEDRDNGMDLEESVTGDSDQEEEDELYDVEVIDDSDDEGDWEGDSEASQAASDTISNSDHDSDGYVTY